MNTVTHYKIKDVETGRFSKGGTWPSFDAKGKTWTTRAGLMNHIRLVGTGPSRGYNYRHVIVCFEVTVRELEGMESVIEHSARLNQAFQARKLQAEQKRIQRASDMLDRQMADLQRQKAQLAAKQAK